MSEQNANMSDKIQDHPDKYESWRSGNDKWLNVICYDGTFDHAVPQKIRHRGPWMGSKRGLVSRLKSWNRHALEMTGYVIIRCHQMDFQPEDPNLPTDQVG
jgi:hypothetical protein